MASLDHMEDSSSYDISFETVLNHLPELTYKTVVVTLDPIEVATFAAAKECYHNRKHLPPALKSSLSALERRLDEAVSLVGIAFVKLEQHSPIDVAAEATFAPSNQAFRRKLSSLRSRTTEGIIWAWREAVMEGLAVRSGLDAMRISGIIITQLLISSTRTQPRANQCRIYVRQFVDHQTHMRFRCFVRSSNVTAITQMSPYYHSEIEADELRLRERLVSAVALTVGRIPTSSFIVDLNFTKKEEVIISDLHPFSQTVHPGCFRWKDDRNVLEGGPLEFRFRHQPAVQSQTDMPAAWLDIVSELFGDGHAASTAITSLGKRIIPLLICITVVVVMRVKKTSQTAELPT